MYLSNNKFNFILYFAYQRNMRLKIKYLNTILFIFILIANVNGQGLFSKKKNRENIMFQSKSKKGQKLDHDKLQNKSSEREYTVQTDCPHTKKRTVNKLQPPVYKTMAKANLIRSSILIEFDLVELDAVHLDIPAFKLFKNNRTDFTEDGQHQFEAIITKIEKFLGENHEGKGVTLKIVGSASQIPTSFDPSMPNNNLNPDGSSIPNKTSVENNILLAKARADELAKKIIKIFPQIKIQTPSLSEIQLGETPWTRQTQLALNQAAMRSDYQQIKEIYEPFQKDQWVKVESKDRTTRTVQPEAIKMYRVSSVPYIKTKFEGKEIENRSLFIVSKNTFQTIGDHHLFPKQSDRDHYLKKMNLIIHCVKNSKDEISWYLLTAKELELFKIENKREMIYKQYQQGIIDDENIDLIEEMMIQDIKSLSLKNSSTNGIAK